MKMRENLGGMKKLAVVCGLLLAWTGLGLAQERELPKGAQAATDGKVWGALVYSATGEAVPLPAGVPKSLSDLNERLGKIFQLSRHEVLGQHTQDIFRQYESWVVPSKDLFLKIDSKGPTDDKTGMHLSVQVWRQQEVLVKTDVVLRAGSPLIIGGPKWREGRLVFVLQLLK
jgi:hypothetical protein